MKRFKLGVAGGLRSTIICRVVPGHDGGEAMKRTFLALAIAILSCSMLAGTAAAQAVASISGTVLDQTGAAIPNATVSAMNQGTNQTRTVATDATGHYAIPHLPVSTY